MIKRKKKINKKFKVDIIGGELIGEHETRSGTTLDFYVQEGYFSFELTNSSNNSIEYDIYYLDNGEVNILGEDMVGFLHKSQTEVIEGIQGGGRFEWKTLEGVTFKDKILPSKFFITFYEPAEELDLVARPVTESGEHEGVQIGEEEEFHRGLRHSFIININGI